MSISSIAKLEAVLHRYTRAGPSGRQVIGGQGVGGTQTRKQIQRRRNHNHIAVWKDRVVRHIVL